MQETLYQIEDNSPVLRIGKVGENEFRTFRFDVTPWVTVYPAGEILGIYRRPDGLAYPVPLSRRGNTAAWTVTNTDLAVAGHGEMELRIVCGAILGKSARFACIVSEAIAPGTTPETPGMDWLAQIVKDTTDAAEAARQAKEDLLAAAERGDFDGAPGCVDDEQLEDRIDAHLKDNPPTIPLMSDDTPGTAKVGDNLKMSEDGHLSLDTADTAEADDPRPITSAAVHEIVGGIDTFKDKLAGEIADTVKEEVPLVKTAEAPVFASSLLECTDEGKVYLLPDGYLYAGSDKTCTNLLPTLIDVDGSIYNGIGYKDNTQIGSGSGKEYTYQDWYSTGLIPFSGSDVLRMRGSCVEKNNVDYIIMYDANRTILRHYTTDTFSSFVIQGNGDVLFNEHGTLGAVNPDMAYIRFCVCVGKETPDFDSMIITVNEEIVDGFYNTGVLYHDPDSEMKTYTETGSVGQQKNAADANNAVWSKWNSRLAFGMRPESAPVPFAVGGQMLVDGTIIASNANAQHTRWGYHVYEAYARDNYSRMTMLLDKHDSEAGGKPSLEYYYYIGGGHDAASYGNTKIGSDVLYHSFCFDRDKMTAYGEVDAKMPITLARISLANDIDTTYETVAAADSAYEPENHPDENNRCLKYIALKNAENGAMFYDTDRNKPVMKINGVWCEIPFTEITDSAYDVLGNDSAQ